MYKILVVDDEERIRRMITKYAELEGYSTEEASDGIEAIEKCRKNKYDILIIDIMMPELDGFSACREIRKFSDVPIIMLSARGEEYDKLNGFGLGVDDYVVKPFSPKELMMRIDAIMKRAGKKGSGTGGSGAEHEIIEIEGLKADLTARIVYVDNEKVEMSPKEYDLFFYMLKNRNIALTRERLISEVWGYDFFGDDRTLDTHIKLLRKSLGKYASLIVTLRGVGYRFDANI
ncbi:MAG: response regulator transcription factor [Clostridia bacterium]|nr:response regulator transcription factor [Clostridia bacterium]MCD8003510.1 response regulator transcription factor [Clostridia bacterium]